MWMSVRVSSVFVLSWVGSGLATGLNKNKNLHFRTNLFNDYGLTIHSGGLLISLLLITNPPL
jgi:hypothetical protein